MKKPHKHAELIKAWADGAEIEWRPLGSIGNWMPVPNPGTWGDHIEYRVKPEVKTDYKSIRDFVEPIYNTFKAESNLKIQSLVGNKISFDGVSGFGNKVNGVVGIVKSIRAQGEVPFAASVVLEDNTEYMMLNFAVYD